MHSMVNAGMFTHIEKHSQPEPGPSGAAPRVEEEEETKAENSDINDKSVLLSFMLQR